MSGEPTLETRILQRFLANLERDKSIPPRLLNHLREAVNRRNLPDVARLEAALEEAVAHADD
jgi:hypothetical protein